MNIFGQAAKNLEANAATLVTTTATAAKAVRDALCPVDTGALLASGHLEQVGPYEVDVVEGTGLGDARARFTEMGTVRAAARPHMTPGIQSQRQPFESGMRKLLK